MFQSFEDSADPSLAADRVHRLRERFDDACIDAFIVPRSDEYQGEYVPPHAERLNWLTGFSGSAGAALILRDKAVIFVDGRYTIQVRNQTDPSVFDYENLIKTPPHSWLEANARAGFRLGFDPWLHTIREAGALRKSLEKNSAELIALDGNPVDAIWPDQPAPPLGRVEIQDKRFAGRPAKEKLKELVVSMKENGISRFVLTDPSSIAWTFNIRGSDVPHTPLALGFAILDAEGEHLLFMDKRKLPMKVEAYLTQLSTLRPPAALEKDLAELARNKATIGLDPALAAERLRLIVESNNGGIKLTSDPSRLPRATKNRTEIQGSREAHRRDGAAVTRFIFWLDQKPPGTIDEIAAAEKLEACRRETGEQLQMPLRDISFDTISGAGPNGAIIHYRVTTRTNRKLEPDTLYLVDSGAQYSDGTTDITRTILIGEASDQMRRHYTIVLKGLIQISLLRFPEGTRGMDIDAVARLAHWKAGLDYPHGTGHGVGSFLSVHEGPQRISRTGSEKLVPGMILSNEPGYYREGRYGIRLENLVLVREPEPIDGGDTDMLGFETLTLAPFDRRLIEVAMLTNEEREWLDTYHDRVEREIGPMLEAGASEWLKKACAPLG